MIRALLVMKPVFDKVAFHSAVESVTGKNYLRDTDSRNLKTHMGEIESILKSYSNPHYPGKVIPAGFVFIGASNLVAQIPSIVTGNCLTNQEANSPMLASMFVVATLSNWEEAYNGYYGDIYLEQCFISIEQQLKSMIPPCVNRLN